MSAFDEKFKQAERLPTDGAISVRHNDDDGGPWEWEIAVETIGVGGVPATQTIRMSAFNASRVAGSLCVMLGIKIVKGQRILL